MVYHLSFRGRVIKLFGSGGRWWRTGRRIAGGIPLILMKVVDTHTAEGLLKRLAVAWLEEPKRLLH